MFLAILHVHEMPSEKVNSFLFFLERTSRPATICRLSQEVGVLVHAKLTQLIASRFWDLPSLPEGQHASQSNRVSVHYSDTHCLNRI